MSWQETASAVGAKFGYLVCQVSEPKKVGDVLRNMHYEGEPCGQPFIVVAEASEEEFTRQAEYVGYQPEAHYKFFYKVTTE